MRYRMTAKGWANGQFYSQRPRTFKTEKECLDACEKNDEWLRKTFGEPGMNGIVSQCDPWPEGSVAAWGTNIFYGPETDAERKDAYVASFIMIGVLVVAVAITAFLSW